MRNRLYCTLETQLRYWFADNDLVTSSVSLQKREAMHTTLHFPLQYSISLPFI
jgi:hypothetical protein